MHIAAAEEITHRLLPALVKRDFPDRVALMTRRPGRVKEILEVGIARPRDPETVRRSTRYLELREHIWHQLKVEVVGGNGR